MSDQLTRRTEPRLPLLAGVAAFGLAAATAWLPSYWTDEAATVSVAGRPTPDLIRVLEHVDLVHGLYYLLLHPWLRLFGTSPEVARLPSCALYAATVALIVAIADTLLLKWGPAVAAVVALALPGLSWTGLEARTFTLALALVCLSMLALLRSQESSAWRLIYCICLPLMVLAEVYTLLILPAQLIWLLGTPPAHRRRIARLALPGAAVTLGFFLLLVRQEEQLATATNLRLRSMSLLVGMFFQGPRDGAHLSGVAIVGSDIAAAIVMGGVLVALGCWRDRTSAFLAAWGLIPPLVLYAAAFVRPELFAERYLAFAAPAMVVLSARALARAPRHLLAVLLVGVAVACLPMQVAQRAEGAKAGDDYAALARSVRERAPRLVWFDADAARGIALAYPGPFEQVRDVRLLKPVAQTDRLWGASRTEGQSLTALRDAGGGLLVVVYGRGGLHRSSGARAAEILGCAPDGGIHGARWSLEYFGCPR